ncbi:MAG: 1-acyl-sn-glycerol-3-phosphate acyltransferase [Chitinophagaceae bacterium]|nr:1-acyl-sn-glycerol-3-phosphate acyltransferase [Chitinophagaceae bacterium]MBL0056075.1 1-acyl-sn-glycerol-3-phosphate acyltransferase [Chitinophagaceae bacterium]
MNQWTRKIKESRLVKALVYSVVGSLSYPGLTLFNKMRIRGMDRLSGLPAQNVLFVCNHQTYFADVIALLHVFCAVSWGKRKRLGVPYYLFWPYTRIKFVSAEETMKKNWIGKLFSLAGSIWVKRTWVADDQVVRKGLNPSDTRKIAAALDKNWVITFPQGTTTPYVPGRKGTAFIIKHAKPIVIPVVFTGFSTAFDKKGLRLVKKNTQLTITFKEPLDINYDDSLESILEQVMDAIEQSQKFAPARTNP